MSQENPDFLKKKYDLHNSEEVESAADRTEAQSGEKVPQKPAARIQNYLERFKEITDRTDPDEREQGMRALKTVLHDKFVIKPDNIPESYFTNQQRIAREQGHGDVEITPEARQQLSEVIVTDQKTTLDTWVDYLASKDATYPDWLKYYAFRSVVGLSTFDKEKHEFGKRAKDTVAPFPDLNREALAYVLDAIEKKYDGKVPHMDTLEGEDRERFAKLLQGENFGKLYAWAIEQVTPASAEQLTITEGIWRKFGENSDHMALVKSLQGHGTGWCTAGESTAEAQLKNGDFYVYYSHNAHGKPTIPRAAIRMEGERIAEVRGIAADQNLDPYIGDVVQSKLKEFGSEGEAYQKKSADMKQLTVIEGKAKAGEQLTKDELMFLYEVESPIQGFGYGRDPRVKQLRKERNQREDAPIILGCASEEIAWGDQGSVTPQTKVYIGPIFPGIFKRLGHLEHIYINLLQNEALENELEFYVSRASFSEENRIRLGSVKIGMVPKESIESELSKQNINLSNFARDLLQSPDYKAAEQPEHVDLVRLTVGDLFPIEATTEQIYAKADELGLELCPADVGPSLRLHEDTEKQFGKSFFVGMKQISDSNGHLGVFCLNRFAFGPWLGTNLAEPSHRWGSSAAFIFRCRKKPN